MIPKGLRHTLWIASRTGCIHNRSYLFCLIDCFIRNKRRIKRTGKSLRLLHRLSKGHAANTWDCSLICRDQPVAVGILQLEGDFSGCQSRIQQLDFDPQLPQRKDRKNHFRGVIAKKGYPVWLINELGLIISSVSINLFLQGSKRPAFFIPIKSWSFWMKLCLPLQPTPSHYGNLGNWSKFG